MNMLFAFAAAVAFFLLARLASGVVVAFAVLVVICEGVRSIGVREPPRHRPRVGVLAAAALFLALDVGLTSAGSWLDRKERTFDPVVWRQPRPSLADLDEERWREWGRVLNARFRMADDLLERYAFDGWTIEEVRALLGREEEEREKEDGTVLRIYYLSGPDHATYGPDDDLVFRFGEDGVVERVEKTIPR